ncbi:MAG: hypothetical protein PHW73_00035 [Atribacterota bacterium]|nr:hypothetical protein [Atribacterota bacterium]
MKTYKISLLDKISKDLEFQETITTDNLSEIEKRLHELQLGYCQDEKPTVETLTVSTKKGMVQAMIAESDCDFSYICALKKL